MKRKQVILIAAILVCTSTIYASTPWLHTEGNKIKDPVGNTVVLRGVDLIDLGFLEDWHGGAYEMIDRLTDQNNPEANSPGWYPKVFRIMVTPPDTVGYGWPHPFSPDNNDLYNLLRGIVDYCKQKDVYAIIDWHYVANTYQHRQSTSEFWEYMAPKFANDSHVLFELFNEPINDLNGDWIFNNNDVNDWNSVRQDMQTWVNIVRQKSPKNLILVAGAFYAQVLKPTVNNPIEGTNIVYVVHIYPGHFFNWFWSDSFQYVGRSHKDEIMSCAAVYPVMMTEWGFSQTYDVQDLNGTISNYGQPLMDFIESNGISNSAWVASYNWGPPMFWPDWTLRVGEGEMGGFVKDNLYIKRNENQPCDTSTTAIEVSPLSFNFGEVELRKSVTFTVSISNKGCGPLIINSVELKTDSATTSLSTPTAAIQPGESINLEVAYVPAKLGANSAVLEINSNDANNPMVEVNLTAQGVLSLLTPSEQIEDIEDFFDESVEDGPLQWPKPGKGEPPDFARPFQRIMRTWIEAASKSIEQGKYPQACSHLDKITRCFNGQNGPHITGAATEEMVGKLQILTQTLNCK